MMAGLHLEPLVAPWAILLVALALAAAGFAYYLRWDEGLPARRRKVLLALRGAGMALALLILVGPSTSTSEILSRGRALSVLIDTSGSMAEADSGPDGATARLDAARAALLQDLDSLAENYDLKMYSFDRHPAFLVGAGASNDEIRGVLAKLEAAGDATALAEAIAAAAPRTAPSALLVLSDGASNAGGDQAAVAADLAGRGVTVFAAPFGKAGRPNVSVKRVLGANLLLRGEPSAFFAEVAFSTAVTGPAKVVLKRLGKVVARGEAWPGRGASLVRLDFTPTEDGDLTYTIEAEPLVGEENTADNIVERTVRVAGEKLKVLYVEGEARWEYRFLKNAILRDDRLAPKLLLRFADSEIAAAEHNISRFPPTRAELFSFDVVVIGDVQREFFLPQDMANLRAFVSEGGGGLLFVVGERANPAQYRGTLLGQLAPADVKGRAALADDGARLTLTDAGRANPALSLSAGDQAEFWKGLPEIFWLLDVKPRAGATVLAETVGGARPVIIDQRFGRGRTMLIATDELWRWRRNVGDKYIYRLWAQLVRYLGARRLGSGMAAGGLTLSRAKARLGEKMQATAYLENGLGMPHDAETAEGFVEGPQGRRAQLVFTKAAEGKSLFRAAFPTAAEGAYTLYVEGPTGFLSAPFTVKDEPLETLSREAEIDALRGIATATGGKLLSAEALKDLVEHFPPATDVTTRTRTSPLWPSYWLLAAMAGAFCLEWYLRKRWDLM